MLDVFRAKPSWMCLVALLPCTSFSLVVPLAKTINLSVTLYQHDQTETFYQRAADNTASYKRLGFFEFDDCFRDFWILYGQICLN